MTIALMTAEQHKLDAKKGYDVKMSGLVREAGFTKKNGTLDIVTFASKADISYATAYVMVKDGLGNPNLDTLQKVSRALGVEITDLLS